MTRLRDLAAPTCFALAATLATLGSLARTRVAQADTRPLVCSQCIDGTSKCGTAYTTSCSNGNKDCVTTCKCLLNASGTFFYCQ